MVRVVELPLRPLHGCWLVSGFLVVVVSAVPCRGHLLRCAREDKDEQRGEGADGSGFAGGGGHRGRGNGPYPRWRVRIIAIVAVRTRSKEAMMRAPIPMVIRPRIERRI